MEEQTNWEIVNITNFNFIDSQRINEMNGISVNKSILDNINKIFIAAREKGVHKKNDLIELKKLNMVKQRILTPEEAKGFISITLVSVLSILLLGFGIFKLIGIFIFK